MEIRPNSWAKLITDKYILGINSRIIYDSRNRPNKKLPREIIDLYVMIQFLK